MILDNINHPNDIHKIPLSDFPLLADEIREFLISSVSKTGGHLASNLGAVELTMALHNVLNFPEDKLIWDVGHQAYTHKILTGRKDAFATLRKEGGLSGFPKRSESPCDSFDAGHSSNSISAGLGYVHARDLQRQNHRVVSVIGDGALTGGMAYEALNNAALLKTNFIIVLNDNNMSISRNVGGMSSYLSTIRTAESYTGFKLGITKTLNKMPKVGPAMVDTVRRTKSSIKQLIIPGMLFENMGLTYLGPVDGHNMRQMMRLFNEAKKVEGPVLVHVLTEKGHGYLPAETSPDRFHGTGPFDITTGELLSGSKAQSYTDVFGKTFLKLAKEEPRLVALTAAMPGGTGLQAFAKAYPERFFDVGIAEGHAVTFAGGLALGGMIPVFAVYSSFLQRGFDQLVQDICMQKLHVIFAIDRAGLVGADGETHHGCFDISYLTMIPNMTVLAPKDGAELEEMLRFAIHCDGPVAIRYPKGNAAVKNPGVQETIPVEYGRSEVIHRGKKVAVLSLGSMTAVCQKAMEQLRAEGMEPTFVNARFAKPLDVELLDELAKDHEVFVTVEENVKNGGYGEHVNSYLMACQPGVRVENLSVWDHFVPQGNIDRLQEKIGLSVSEVVRIVEEYWN
ncbi:MAG: 1-deoxy-D-xylulose-5-phosphate synthase [Eubacteriales bacterium]|nr:1-deoxy-D-xylulose-5-phosphate synthase [Eubacteriales bacterium]